jgi:aspartate aminotransferase
VSLKTARRLDGIERTLIREIFDRAPPGAINLGLGQPDLPTPPEACMAGIRGIVEQRTRYTTTAGDADLRRAVAQRYPTYGGGPESVLITVGSQQALYVACLTLVEEGREVLYPDPGYPAYPTVARLVGARPVPYPLPADRAFRLTAEEVERRLTERTSLVILSAPSNPTGVCHPAGELQRLVRELERRGIAWLSDEVYASLIFDGPWPSPADLAPAGGVVISGLSKEMCMTGWRVGWLVGPPEVIERATAAHQHVVTCAPSVSQRAALAAFGTAGERVRRAWVERLRQRRELMGCELAKLPRIRYATPEGGFYYFVDVSAHGDALELARRILDRRSVVTIPGPAFGRGGVGYLRLSFAAGEGEIERGVARIGEELGG